MAYHMQFHKNYKSKAINHLHHLSLTGNCESPQISSKFTVNASEAKVTLAEGKESFPIVFGKMYFRLLSENKFFHEMKCNGMTSFMEVQLSSTFN